MSRLDLVVGPNGAGKSTFVRFTIGPRWSATVVNADIIAARRWPQDPAAHAYEAAALASDARSQLIAAGRPLIAETVFSHPSKLKLIEAAKHAAYYVALHVLMVPEELAVARVAARVAAGGHDVPTEKIRGRYQRLWPLVADAVLKADTATFWNNSTGDGPQVVALFSDGLAIGVPNWPAWTPTPLVERWPPAQPRTRD